MNLSRLEGELSVIATHQRIEVCGANTLAAFIELEISSRRLLFRVFFLAEFFARFEVLSLRKAGRRKRLISDIHTR